MLLKRVHALIARDEQRHAELGWDIVRFCLARAPEVRSLLLAHAKQNESVVDSFDELVATHHANSVLRLHALCA